MPTYRQDTYCTHPGCDSEIEVVVDAGYSFRGPEVTVEVESAPCGHEQDVERLTEGWLDRQSERERGEW